MGKHPWLVCALCLLWVIARAGAVIIPGEVGRNTSAPTGLWTNSGWQYQGDFGVFSGTPIAPQYFISAGHLGGTAGQVFSFGGVDYNTTAAFDDPSSDLRIFKIDGTFPSYAPLYRSRFERLRRIVIYGRGTARGEEILLGARRKGWAWGEDDHLHSWGINQVSRIITGSEEQGQLLVFPFIPRLARNEGTVSEGDSGGGVFIRDRGVWKLVGINYGVQGPFSETGQDGSGFFAALFDEGGFYLGGDGEWSLIPDRYANIPLRAYATRVSSNLPWINSVLSGDVSADAMAPVAGTGVVPEPISPALAATLGLLLLLSRRRKMSCGVGLASYTRRA